MYHSGRGFHCATPRGRLRGGLAGATMARRRKALRRGSRWSQAPATHGHSNSQQFGALMTRAPVHRTDPPLGAQTCVRVWGTSTYVCVPDRGAGIRIQLSVAAAALSCEAVVTGSLHQHRVEIPVAQHLRVGLSVCSSRARRLAVNTCFPAASRCGAPVRVRGSGQRPGLRTVSVRPVPTFPLPCALLPDGRFLSYSGCEALAPVRFVNTSSTLHFGFRSYWCLVMKSNVMFGSSQGS